MVSEHPCPQEDQAPREGGWEGSPGGGPGEPLYHGVPIPLLLEAARDLKEALRQKGGVRSSPRSYRDLLNATFVPPMVRAALLAPGKVPRGRRGKVYPLSPRALAQILYLMPEALYDVARYLIRVYPPEAHADLFYYRSLRRVLNALRTRGLAVREVKAQAPWVADLRCPVIFPPHTPDLLLEVLEVEREASGYAYYYPEDDESLLSGERHRRHQESLQTALLPRGAMEGKGKEEGKKEKV